MKHEDAFGWIALILIAFVFGMIVVGNHTNKMSHDKLNKCIEACKNNSSVAEISTKALSPSWICKCKNSMQISL